MTTNVEVSSFCGYPNYPKNAQATSLPNSFWRSTLIPTNGAGVIFMMTPSVGISLENTRYHKTPPGPSGLSEIAKLRALEVGWDGEEAAPPNEWSLGLAEEVLYMAAGKGISPSHIGPCIDEGVTIVFVQGPRKAMVEVFNSREIAGVTSEGKGRTDAFEITDDTESLDDALDRISEFLA
jgi:hypothetical protein